MTDWAVGLSTGCLYHYKLNDVLEPVRAKGFHQIETGANREHFDYDDPVSVSHVRESLQKLGLKTLSFHGPFGDHIDISSPDKKMRSESVNEILRAVRAAAVIDAKFFLLHPGPEKEGKLTDGHYFRRLKSCLYSLERIFVTCREYHLELILENMLPHLYLGGPEDILWLIGKMESGIPGICLDTGHANTSRNASDMYRRFSRHVRMLHVHDNHGNEDEHLIPGNGDIKWAELFQLMKSQDYNGALMLEIGSGDKESTEEILERAVKGRSFLLDAMKKLS